MSLGSDTLAVIKEPSSPSVGSSDGGPQDFPSCLSLPASVEDDPLSGDSATGGAYCGSLFSLGDVEGLWEGLFEEEEQDGVISLDDAPWCAVSDVFDCRGFFTGDLGIFLS